MTSASHDFNLTDRVIIVTGAGKGLGAIAEKELTGLISINML